MAADIGGQDVHGSNGTRFRLFSQAPFLDPGKPPEIVQVSVPAGAIGPGPSDRRMFVITPIGKRRPYGLGMGPLGTPVVDLPPWRGPVLPAAMPGPGGHFDHLPADSTAFVAAHLYGCVRFTLDVWERYFGRPIAWHFAAERPRLEIVNWPGFENARMGYGFLEVGAERHRDGSLDLFALNFDVVAHETGHLILYSTLGVPRASDLEAEYSGFQEASADAAAMVALLHFNTFIDGLLAQTRGNLYSFNELNRFAELSTSSEIRLASNATTMWDFAAGWSDEHALSQPFMGALFDIFIDVFQENLVDRGLIPRDLADLCDRIEKEPWQAPVTQAAFDAAYPGHEAGFRAALVDARDFLGEALAVTWQKVSADRLTFAEVAAVMIDVADALSRGRFRAETVENFRWRAIGLVDAGPRRHRTDGAGHGSSARAIVPDVAQVLPRPTFAEKMLIACNR